MERKRYLVGDDVQAKRAALGRLIVSRDTSKGQAKAKYTLPLACAGAYGVPPGEDDQAIGHGIAGLDQPGKDPPFASGGCLLCC
jgi:hypothetical protein